MLNFYILITIQCVIFGTALYLYISTVSNFVTIGGWKSKVCNFLIAQIFLFAMIFIGLYWYDTIETKNTIFSEPAPKFIEIEVKTKG